MYEIRFHGRGGQGAVTSAELMAQAVIEMGGYAQAFPSFGPERRGAPVLAFLRIDQKPIRLRTIIKQPDIVVVLDPSLYKVVKITEGLKKDGWVIINSTMEPTTLRQELNWDGKIAVVNANQIAREEIGRVITNTTMLGSLLKVIKVTDENILKEKLRERFGEEKGEQNIKAFERALKETVIG